MHAHRQVSGDNEVEVPEVLTGIAPGGYSDSRARRTADEHVIDHVEAELSELVSMLDERHDRYVEAEARVAAERVRSVRNTIQSISRDLSQPRLKRSGTGGNRPRIGNGARLVSVHRELVELVEDLGAVVEDLTRNSGESDLPHDRIDVCQRRIGQLRHALDEREKLLAEAGENT